MMSNIDLHQDHSPEDLAGRVAAAWIASIRAAAQTGRRQIVALSGGRIAKTFFAATARLALAEKLSFDHLEFFWGDERCVPAEHPDSNFKLAKDNLFDPLGIRPEQLHPLCCGDDGRSTAARLSVELQRVADRDAGGVPVFDLVFLGMGEDAHVASLFPEEPEEVRNLPDIYRPVTATKPPPRRITLGYHVIAVARGVWVLAAGAGKTEALAASCEPGSRTPLGRVLHSRPQTRLYTAV